MNYEEANSVKELAAPVNKVLEGLEVECSECEGTGEAVISIENRDKHPALDGKCPQCISARKVKYSWIPQVGEWCLDKYKVTPKLIIHIGAQLNGTSLLRIAEQYGKREELATSVTPILEWEEIISVLKAFGFVMTVSIGQSGGQIRIYHRQRDEVSPSIIFDKMYSGKPQPAVMRTVIALGKELKC